MSEISKRYVAVPMEKDGALMMLENTSTVVADFTDLELAEKCCNSLNAEIALSSLEPNWFNDLAVKEAIMIALEGTHHVGMHEGNWGALPRDYEADCIFNEFLKRRGVKRA